MVLSLIPDSGKLGMGMGMGMGMGPRSPANRGWGRAQDGDRGFRALTLITLCTAPVALVQRKSPTEDAGLVAFSNGSLLARCPLVRMLSRPARRARRRFRFDHTLTSQVYSNRSLQLLPLLRTSQPQQHGPLSREPLRSRRQA